MALCPEQERELGVTQDHNRKPEVMNSQPADNIIQKIIESTSTRALGWILEKHCELIQNVTLEIVFVGNNRMAWELLQNYSGQSSFGRMGGYRCDVYRTLCGIRLASMAKPPPILNADQIRCRLPCRLSAHTSALKDAGARRSLYVVP
jgi:hypothetical protein